MIFSLLVFFGMLLQLAVTNPVHNLQPVNLTYNDHQDPEFWQNSGQIEGDMVLTPKEVKNLYSDSTGRNGITKTKLRWPNKVISYEISTDFTIDEKRYIESVLKEDFGRTCISVVQHSYQIDYVYITGKDTGCHSAVGRQGKKQILNLQRDKCLSYRTIVHEFLHAAGFHHQHSTSNRDRYVTIKSPNILPGHENDFKKYGRNEVDNFGQLYDYDSVMHYTEYAFSRNGQRTIAPIKASAVIGQGQKLSSIDIAKLNKMYNC